MSEFEIVVWAIIIAAWLIFNHWYKNRPVHPGTDWDTALRDQAQHHYRKDEIRRKLQDGDYAKKD